MRRVHRRPRQPGPRQRTREEGVAHGTAPPRGGLPWSREPGTEAGSYLRIIDSCITQLKAEGPSRTCNESKEEEEPGGPHRSGGKRQDGT